MSALTRTFRRTLEQIEGAEERLAELGCVVERVLVFQGGRPVSPYDFALDILTDLLQARMDLLMATERRLAELVNAEGEQ
jgi:hypothetical protein